MIDNFAHRAAEWDNPSKIEMTSIFFNALQDNILIEKTWKALEIGAGTGLVGLQVLAKLNSVVFEDTSEAMLSVLKQKLKGTEQIEIVHGEVFEYNKSDIDFVFSCMAFHHLPDIDAVLNHLYKITNNAATIVIGDIRTEDGSFHSFEPIAHKGFDTIELSKKFVQAGFEVISTNTYNTLKRERIEGKISEYEQFLLIAKKIK